MSQSLSDWLSLLESRHPKEIELGLGRVQAAYLALQQLTRQPAQQPPSKYRPAKKVVNVAGTNGKGSCIAVLDAVLRQAGLTTGTYTSPHLIRFNERITLNGQQASDQQLCDVFELVEAAREKAAVSLTYFEFTTLAALELIRQAEVDVALLEIGLGGRLDAVNIVDPDIAIVTSVALDHQDWLGSDIDFIGHEKGAIGRPGKPLIYGDTNPVAGVLDEAGEISAQLLRNGVEFCLADGIFSFRQ